MTCPQRQLRHPSCDARPPPSRCPRPQVATWTREGRQLDSPPAARRLRKAGMEAPPNEREVPGVGVCVGGRGEDASAPRQGPVQGRGEREGDCYGETSRQVAVTPELAGRYLGEFSIA